MKIGAIFESKILKDKVFVLCKAPVKPAVTHNLTRWYTLVLQSDVYDDIGKITNRFFYMDEQWTESKL